jgi:hypothetical protein
VESPRIIGVHVSAGHDGSAEAVIDVQYPNGAVRTMTLDADLGLEALARLNLTSLDDLVGQPWSVLVNGA